jgi:competence protein ComEC
VGNTLEFDGVKIEVLGPGRPFITHTESDPNNNSIILRVSYHRTRILFPGDAQHEEWRRVLSAGLEIQAEILKVPHHGSHDATSGRMLRAIRPEVGIISCGRHNEYGHPHRSTLRLFRRHRVRIYRTDRDGSIKVVVFPNRYQVIPEKGERGGRGDRR